MSSDLKMLSCTFSNFKNTISSKLKAKCQFFSFAFKIALFTDFYNSSMLPLLRFRYSNQSHCWISISHVYIWYLNNPIQKHGFFSFFLIDTSSYWISVLVSLLNSLLHSFAGYLYFCNKFCFQVLICFQDTLKRFPSLGALYQKFLCSPMQSMTYRLF